MPVLAASDDEGKPPGEIAKNRPDPGWNETTQQFHTTTKSFHFPSLSEATTFCVEILTFPHNDDIQLSALEEKSCCNVRVSIHVTASTDYEKNRVVQRMMDSVEELYHDVVHPKRTPSFWPWKNSR